MTHHVKPEFVLELGPASLDSSLVSSSSAKKFTMGGGA